VAMNGQLYTNAASVETGTPRQISCAFSDGQRSRAAVGRSLMKRFDRILIGLAAAMLLTAPAAAQKVSYDIGDADFSGMKTFAFKNSPVDEGATSKTTYDSPLITERTHAAIAAQLEARGLRQVDRNPDMYVSTQRVFKTEYEVYGYGSPYWGLGYGW